MNYPRAFSHIGITVPDLDRAVEFYTNVLGFYLIMPQTTVKEDHSPIGIMCKDVFGDGFGSFRIAHLSTSDKIGVEIFEFPESKKILRLNLIRSKQVCSIFVCKILIWKV